MSLLQDIQTDDSLQDTDVLGGGGPWESGVYDLTVTVAYLGKAASGANSLTIHAKSAEGREIRQTVYFTSGTKKGCKTFSEKDGNRKPLPGFNLANALCLLTVGKPLLEMEKASKIINLYSKEAGKEVPTEVPVLVDLCGVEISAAIFRQTVDKNVDTGQVDDQGSKVYAPTGETRDENEIDKFFRKRDGLTVAEIMGGATEAKFINEWKEKWEGVTRNRATGTAGNSAFGGKAAANDAAKERKSLFN